LPLLLLPFAQAVDVAHTTGPVTIDGRLDEPAWAEVVPITEFVRSSPTQGGAPPGLTEVRFMHNDTVLYVGVRVDHGRPVRYRMAPREDLNQDDQIGIFLDTFQDQRAGYVFYLNPLGVQQDLRVNAERWNFYWDAVIDSAGQVDGNAWEVEVAIPFRSLKYPAVDGPQEWGLILQRIDIHDMGVYTFPETERHAPSVFSQAVPLRLEPPRRGSGLEIMPVITAIQQGSQEDDDDPLEWTGFRQPLQAFRPSLDARFGITPNIGFAGTVNPDFSQVENDETRIDLNQRFAFWYPERRPFFLDGFDLFEDRHEILYTRSIVEPVGGAKVGGKEGGVSVGLLHAIDQSPMPSVHEHGAPGFGPEDVEGTLAANSVARVAVDVLGSGYVGLSFADKRILPPGGGPAGAHDIGGLDVRIPLGNRWIAAGGALASHTTDGHGESLTGYGFSGGITRFHGIGTGGYLRGQWSHPDLRMETGYAPQTGLGEVSARIDHTFEPGVVDTVMPFLEVEVRSESDGDGWAYAQAQVEMHEGPHGLGVWYGRRREWEDDDKVDGGFLGAWYWARPTAWLEMNPVAYTGRVLDYFRDDSAPDASAQSTGLDLRFTLWPTRHTRFDTSIGQRWFTPETGPVRRSTLLRGKLGYQFSRTLGARLIGEYSGSTVEDDSFESFFGSVLLTWLLHPGTGVWIGYKEEGTLDGPYAAQSREVFAKVSILFRP
jgi:hypothetical protein